MGYIEGGPAGVAALCLISPFEAPDPPDNACNWRGPLGCLVPHIWTPLEQLELGDLRTDSCPPPPAHRQSDPEQLTPQTQMYVVSSLRVGPSTFLPISSLLLSQLL